MPEGDSVYRTCADLHHALVGRVLTRVDLRVPRFATAGDALVGRTVDEVSPRGKHLLIRVGDHTIHSHLGMDGAWSILAPSARWPAPSHHVRAVLENDGAVALGTQLPVLELLPRDREDDAVGHLGVDLLARDWGDDHAARAVAALAADPGRELASALLDQRNLAGLGNMYVTELCFLRGVRPTAPVAAAGDLGALVALARRLLRANRMRPDRRVFTGTDRRGSRTWVYGRERLPCRRCGTIIAAGTHGEDARRSAWCPNCQASPDTG